MSGRLGPGLLLVLGVDLPDVGLQALQVTVTLGVSGVSVVQCNAKLHLEFSKLYSECEYSITYFHIMKNGSGTTDQTILFSLE